MQFKILFFIFLASFHFAKAQESETVDVLTFGINSDGTIGGLKSDTTISYFEYGKMDAKKYYKSYKNAATLTILSGTCLMLVSPVAGLTSAIACSSTPPKFKNLNIPDTSLATNIQYMDGYKWQAKKIKQRKVWTNWAIGFGINISVVGLILLVPHK